MIGAAAMMDAGAMDGGAMDGGAPEFTAALVPGITPARQSDGDWPVHRRNARVNELPAENPSK